MQFLGDFPEDFASVTCMWTTHASAGSPVAPSSAFEAADIRIYRDGSDVEKTTTNGITMNSPFDGVTGLHSVTIDTGNDTGDGGFWTLQSTYTIVLVPDETVDSVAVVKVLGTFTIGMTAANVWHSVVADYSGVGGSFGSQYQTIYANVDTSLIAGAVWDVTLASHLSGGSTGAALNGAGSAGDPWTTSLPGAYGAGTAGKIIGDNINATISSRATQTSVDDVPTNAELATALAGADDATLAAIAALNNLSQANVRSAVGLASANLDTQLSTIDDFLDTEVAAILAAVDTEVGAIKTKTDQITFSTANRVDAQVFGMESGTLTSAAIANSAIASSKIATDAIGSAQLAATAITEIQTGLSTLTTAQVNAEVVDALNVDTYTEPGTGAPAATASVVSKLGYLYKAWRNKHTQDSTTFKLFADDAATVDQKATVSDDGTTLTVGEVASGP